jgi:hypothetical protein
MFRNEPNINRKEKGERKAEEEAGQSEILRESKKALSSLIK